MYIHAQKMTSHAADGNTSRRLLRTTGGSAAFGADFGETLCPELRARAWAPCGLLPVQCNRMQVRIAGLLDLWTDGDLQGREWGSSFCSWGGDENYVRKLQAALQHFELALKLGQEYRAVG